MTDKRAKVQWQITFSKEQDVLAQGLPNAGLQTCIFSLLHSKLREIRIKCGVSSASS
jgi:hypothetical protein